MRNLSFTKRKKKTELQVKDSYFNMTLLKGLGNYGRFTSSKYFEGKDGFLNL